jgi:hypothetical protein
MPSSARWSLRGFGDGIPSVPLVEFHRIPSWNSIKQELQLMEFGDGIPSGGDEGSKIHGTAASICCHLLLPTARHPQHAGACSDEGSQVHGMAPSMLCAITDYLPPHAVPCMLEPTVQAASRCTSQMPSNCQLFMLLLWNKQPQLKGTSTHHKLTEGCLHGVKQAGLRGARGSTPCLPLELVCAVLSW